MHWHVQTHTDDDNTYVTPLLWQAMSYAAEELERRADFERDGITLHGDSGDFESAYHCYVRVQAFDNLAANADNIDKQYTCEFEERAPIYRSEFEYENQARLAVAAAHVIENINTDGPFGFLVWKCTQTECEPKDEEY